MRAARRQSPSPGEHQMSGPTISKPFSQHFAEPTERARDQVTSIRLHLEGWRQWLAALRNKRLRKRHDHFASVFALSHPTEGHVNAACRERAELQRTQRVLPDQDGNFFQELACLFFIATEDRVH